MVATAYVEEAVGWPLGLYRVGLINVVAYDVPAPNDGDALAMAISPGPGGSTGHSYERWFRLGLRGPFTSVRDLRFWMPGLVLTNGWDLRYGLAPTYRAPTRAPSDIATHDPPVTPADIGAGPFFTGPAHSLWIVLQAIVTRETAGPLDLAFRFSYTED